MKSPYIPAQTIVLLQSRWAGAGGALALPLPPSTPASGTSLLVCASSKLLFSGAMGKARCKLSPRTNLRDVPKGTSSSETS